MSERTVPVFPLPETVLFPGVGLPLHLFEPRYRQLAEDVIAGDGLMVLALLRPGYERDYEGTPAVHETATLGRVERHERLDDGRYNILLFGTERVRLREPAEEGELSPGKLYRARPFTPAPELVPEPGRERLELQESLEARFRELTELSGADEESDLSGAPFHARVNAIASGLNAPAAAKQALLEMDDLGKRALSILELLERELALWRSIARFRHVKPEDPSVN